MKKLITILLLLGISIAFAGWDGWGDPTLFKKPMTFDSTVTFNDSTFFRGAVIDSGNHVVLGDLMVSGAVKPGVVCENIFINTHAHDWLGNGQNTISEPSYPQLSGHSFDSLICDSVRLGFWAQEDTNIVDSLYIASLYGRTASTVVIVADGKDATSGSVGYHFQTYTCSATIPANARLTLQMKPGRESAAGKTIVRILLLYGHPK